MIIIFLISKHLQLICHLFKQMLDLVTEMSRLPTKDYNHKFGRTSYTPAKTIIQDTILGIKGAQKTTKLQKCVAGELTLNRH